MKTMYPAQVNSPGTELASAVDGVQTTIALVDASQVPAPPNMITIGTDDSAETILYTGKSGNNLTGITRGFQGASQSWIAGTKVARNLTAYDIDTMRENIQGITSETINKIPVKLITELPGVYPDGMSVFSLSQAEAEEWKTTFGHSGQGDATLVETTRVTGEYVIVQRVTFSNTAGVIAVYERTSNANNQWTGAWVKVVARSEFDAFKGNTVAQLAQTVKYPALDWEITSGLLVSTAYEYGDVRRFGIVGDFNGSTYTNNYNKLVNLLNTVPNQYRLYFKEPEYYFEGAFGLDTSKQVELIGKCDSKDTVTLRIKAGDGNGITLRGRYTKLSNLMIKGYDATKGVGVRLIGLAPYYVAYCIFENVNVQGGFQTGFYSGDSFYINLRNCLVNGGCANGYQFNNVSTTLNMERCYALDCSNYGYDITNSVYSTLDNCAADNCKISYRLNRCSSLNLNSCGSENHDTTALLIIDSQINLNGFTGDRTRAAGAYGTILNLQNSVIQATNIFENALSSDETDAGSTIVVDATSTLNITASKILLSVYIADGGIVNGNFKVSNTKYSYENGQRVLYGAEPPTAGSYKVGDKVVNTNPNISNNPVTGWVCLVGGTSSDWRPSGYVVQRGSTRPILNGYKHLGVPFYDTTIGCWIYWNANAWTKADGTVV